MVGIPLVGVDVENETKLPTQGLQFKMKENCIPLTNVPRGETQKKSKLLQSTDSCFMVSFFHPQYVDS